MQLTIHYSSPHSKYNKTVLYAPNLNQQGTMLIANILNTDLKVPTLTQFNARFDLEWQENTHDKSYQPFK